MQAIELTADNAVGLDGFFNTCRLGTKWRDRVTPGERLKFVRAEDKSDICEVVVARAVSGKYADMEADHAPLNHAHSDAERLREGLRAAYGDAFSPEATVTFVYVVRPVG